MQINENFPLLPEIIKYKSEQSVQCHKLTYIFKGYNQSECTFHSKNEINRKYPFNLICNDSLKLINHPKTLQ